MFYESLKKHTVFEKMADPSQYTPLPDDWVIGTSDIVGSTDEIAKGRYKTVNMVGAAVISAQINAHEHLAFPYVFGGDGAAFAVPADRAETAAEALAATARWAEREFDIGLRGAVTPMSVLRDAGQDVRVARYQVSDGIDYAMFVGGGISWAETQMKAGHLAVAPAPPDAQPDLTGLSCRWSHMPSQRGHIVSFVIAPSEDQTAAFAEVAADVLAIVRTLDRGGHPAAEIGPGVDWPPLGATLEAHAQRKDGALGRAKRVALFESLVAWILIKTGIVLGGFDARHYRRVVGENADFRKFDDGLKMTLDCDAETLQRLRAVLDKAQADGVLTYGWHAQDEAMMTCIVPSIMRDDHIHFIDGASGGYTQAATMIKTAAST